MQNQSQGPVQHSTLHFNPTYFSSGYEAPRSRLPPFFFPFGISHQLSGWHLPLRIQQLPQQNDQVQMAMCPRPSGHSGIQGIVSVPVDAKGLVGIANRWPTRRKQPTGGFYLICTVF